MEAAHQRRRDVLEAAYRHRDMIKRLDRDTVREAAISNRWVPADPHRFEARLRRRAARRIGLDLDAAAESGTALKDLLAIDDGPYLLTFLCGAACHQSSLRLIVNAARWQELSETLGYQGDIALMRSVAFSTPPQALNGIKLIAPERNITSVAQAITLDGILCWESWLAGLPSSVRLYMNLLAPDLPMVSDEKASDQKDQDAVSRAHLFSSILTNISSGAGRPGGDGDGFS